LLETDLLNHYDVQVYGDTVRREIELSIKSPICDPVKSHHFPQRAKELLALHYTNAIPVHYEPNKNVDEWEKIINM
jgi:hypothetical protein